MPKYYPFLVLVPGAARPKNGRSTADGIVGFVGINLTDPAKGREVLIREFQDLRHDFANAGLHLFGDYGSECLPGVFLHGEYDRSRLDEILLGMDVGIIPSIWPEAYAYVGPEMLSRGIPLIVSVAGAMTEYVIPNFNGLRFDPAKPGDLQVAMRALLTDAPLLARLSDNVRIAVREFHFSRPCRSDRAYLF